ncbi:hypothetical protein KR018_003050 [Drosophila ironensis]|nr:hypothetical protein KR018_003050 [Drosophila ironensis]
MPAIDEELHFHEKLMAKTRRFDIMESEPCSTSNEKSGCKSVTSVESESGTDCRTAGDPMALIQQDSCIYLLEPLILTLLFAYNFSSTVLKNEIIYQSCTAGFGYPNSDCLLLGTKNATNDTERIEEIVQPYATKVTLSMHMIECFVSAFFGLFTGVWLDVFGRKPFLMCAFLGYGLQYLISAIIAYCAMQRYGLVSPWWYLLSILPLSCLGGSVTYSAAALSFIGDVSNGKVRCYRLIAYELAIYGGLLLGSFASGNVYEATDAYVVLSISTGSIFAALVLMIVFLPESLPSRHQSTITYPTNGGRFFTLKDLWVTCTRPREHFNRSLVLINMLVILLTAFISDGSNSVFYMFMRAKFHWSVKQFTDYETVSILIPAVSGSSGVILMWSLRKVTKWAVLWLALVSVLSHLASSLMRAYASLGWHIYVATVLGIFKSLVNPMCRTMITNLLPPEERGKIFALLGILLNLSPLLSSSLYFAVYTKTLNTDPGIFNLVSSLLYGLQVCLIGYVFF